MLGMNFAAGCKLGIAALFGTIGLGLIGSNLVARLSTTARSFYGN